MSAEQDTNLFPQSAGDRDTTDSKKAELGFGPGGVPWLLLLFYLSFLAFFTWYAVEYQLPDFLNRFESAPAVDSSAPE